MIGLLVLLILFITFYIGGRRGTALQLVYNFGYWITFTFAMLFYQGLAEKIELYIPYLSVSEDTKMVYFDQTTALDLDKVYYAAVAFIIIMGIGWLFTKLLAIFFNNLRFKRIFNTNDWIVGGVLSSLNAYVVIYFILAILAMLPLDGIQDIFRNSWVADFIVAHTPILSGLFQNLWITNIL
ncbi:MAG: CvpA family protein [Enterococcus sp.]